MPLGWENEDFLVWYVLNKLCRNIYYFMIVEIASYNVGTIIGIKLLNYLVVIKSYSPPEENSSRSPL